LRIAGGRQCRIGAVLAAGAKAQRQASGDTKSRATIGAALFAVGWMRMLDLFRAQ